MSTSHLEQISATRRDVTVRWLVPDRVIFVAAEGEINSAERNWLNARIAYLMHSCATPQIHLIVDASRIKRISLTSLTHPSPIVRHPRRGWFVSAGASKSRLITLALLLLTRLMNVKYQACDDLNDALDTLQQIDPSLPDLNPYRAELISEGQR